MKPRATGWLAGIGNRRSKTSKVFVAEVALEVVSRGDRYPFLSQHFTKQCEVDRFIIDQYPIEVENHRPDGHQMASGPRSPVRIRTHSDRGRTAIIPSPIIPSGPLRLAFRIAPIVGSTKSSLTAIWSSILRSTFTVTSCPR